MNGKALCIFEDRPTHADHNNNNNVLMLLWLTILSGKMSGLEILRLLNTCSHRYLAVELRDRTQYKSHQDVCVTKKASNFTEFSAKYKYLFLVPAGETIFIPYINFYYIQLNQVPWDTEMWFNLMTSCLQVATKSSLCRWKPFSWLENKKDTVFQPYPL